MNTQGQIFNIEDIKHLEKLTEEHGELVELTEKEAEVYQELPETIRKAIYEHKTTRDGSFTKAKFNKDKVRKKNKAAKKARARNK